MTSPTQSRPPRITPEERQPNPSLGADIIIANAPDPVFVSDLEGRILQANQAVSEL
jgi:PAS domain-containing protein